MLAYESPVAEVEALLNNSLDYRAHYQSLADDFDVDAADVSTILQEVARFADEQLAPLNASGDAQGAKLIDGAVVAPQGFKSALAAYVEAGWPRLAQDREYGGISAPYSLKFLVTEFLQGANQSWCMYTTLNDGAIKVLEKYGSAELQQRYLPSLVSGEWLGTMCLTEPQCGSDLNLMQTKAQPLEDGSYAITGQKIFISSGSHDLSGNIVHLVLARLPEAPAGTAGISLFLVPAKLPNEGCADNAISCLAVEGKMGLKGSATCSLAFDGAKGWLIGKPNRGLQAMFVFINKSRLSAAQQAQAQVEAAFQASLAYARERISGRSASAKGDGPGPIVEHADIQRMLMFQKSISRAARSLLVWCAMQADIADYGSEEEASRASSRLSLLTPIAKGFGCEVAFEAVDYGIQVFGGHGYITETGIEQRLRDVRVTRIYEGTSGIQALDLLGRKIAGPAWAEFDALCDTMLELCRQPAENAVAELQGALAGYICDWRSVSESLVSQSNNASQIIEQAATDYLMMSGYIVYGYFWLKMLLASGGDERADDLALAEFYFSRVLPRAQYHLSILRGVQKPSTVPAAWLS